MFSPPTFSVVIPNHRRVQPVVAAVRSVLRQAPDSLEVLVVDDASPNRDDIAAALDDIGDARVRLISLRDKGTAARARNAGVDAARGEWIAFLDSDDAFEPGKWSALTAAVRATPTADVFYDQAQVSVDGRITKVVPQRPLRDGECIGDFLFVADELLQTGTLTVRRSIIQTVRWRDGLPRHQDLQLVLDLERHGASFVHVPSIGSTIHWSTAARPTSKGESAAYSLNWLDTVGAQLSTTALRKAVFRFGVVKLLEAGHRRAAVRVAVERRAITSPRALVIATLLFCAPAALRAWGYQLYKRLRQPRPVTAGRTIATHAVRHA